MQRHYGARTTVSPRRLVTAARCEETPFTAGVRTVLLATDDHDGTVMREVEAEKERRLST